MTPTITSPLTLPCGATINNRLVKAATTERLTSKDAYPNDALCNLYHRWAATEAGLLISGNVVLDTKHMESAGNVVVREEGILSSMKKWTAAGTSKGNHFWAQISHSGRQTNRFINWQPSAPSAVQLKKMGLFGTPKPMSEAEIQQVINGFVTAARLCKEGGFTGIQIHAAHGYLLSQFLSPTTNKRKDQWGGSLENRSRLLRTIVQKTRETVGSAFPISVKLNSADFMRGGFSEEDSLQVVQMLADEKIDLLEISGGTYEKLVFFLMNDQKQKPLRESTKRREAYFIDFAKKVREVCQVPLMVTGGFRTYDFCNEVLAKKEIDLIGMARPFINNPEDIPAFLTGELQNLEDFAVRTGIHQFEDSAEGGYYARQIIRLANGLAPKTDFSPLACSVFLIKHEFVKAMEKKFS